MRYERLQKRLVHALPKNLTVKRFALFPIKTMLVLSKEKQIQS